MNSRGRSRSHRPSPKRPPVAKTPQPSGVKDAAKGSSQDFVIGPKACREVLYHRPERSLRLLVREGTKSRDVVELAEAKNIPVRFVSEDELRKVAGHDNSQGHILLLKERKYLDLKAFINEASLLEKSLVVAVDDLQDPQNFGSILRAAECFGASAVIWSKNRGVSLTQTVIKVSAGASEFMPLIPVSNLRSSLTQLKEVGFWICSTSLGEGSTSLFDFSFPEKTVLVLGSEGAGVQPLIQKESDILLAIPMYGRLESLNVSQAAAVAMAEYRKHHC